MITLSGGPTNVSAVLLLPGAWIQYHVSASKNGLLYNLLVDGPNMCDDEDVCTRKEERAPSS